jgi:hypothetical protein
MANATWYLGLDLGTTGISAILFNSKQGTILPLSWLQGGTRVSRFPAVAYCGPGVGSGSSPFVVGTEAESLNRQPAEAGIYLAHFKPLLNLALPYYLLEQHQWQPQLQITDSKAVSLYLLQQALRALLLPLTTGGVTVPGDKVEETQAALKQLQGVVVSYPASWGNTYQFNVREAVLSAQLVEQPQQVYFLPEVLAAWLGTDPAPSSSETTLVIHAGASTTDFALFAVPDDLTALTAKDIALSSVDYGGKALAEDTFWQLLFPQWRDSYPHLTVSLEEIPQPGQGGWETRYAALRKLQQNTLEKPALQAADLVQRILQQREVFQSKLGNRPWKVQRSDWNHQIMQPYITRLNQELNHLLSQTGISGQGITQIVLSGKAMTTALEEVREWLQQKLINANIQEFTGHGDLVARGLARLPHYPRFLDRSHHQYSDYFLLSELLTLPSEVLTTDEILHQLQRRGINTKACEGRIREVLQGKLPEGLIPKFMFWLTPESESSLIYQELQASPLFTSEGRGYRLNDQQKERVEHYLSLVLQGTQQKLAEPLGVELG